MELIKFINLCVILLGVIAAIFLSKALFLNAEKILRTTYHYSPMGWPSVNIISDKAGQKADTLASLILIFIVFFLQSCSLFIKRDILFTNSWKTGVLTAIVFLIVLTFIVYNINVSFKKYFEKEIKILAARDYIKSDFEESPMPQYASIEAIASQYFNFRKKDDENNSEYVKRFALFLDYDIPKETDFSKFR